jgi:hypothetical protein
MLLVTLSKHLTCVEVVYSFAFSFSTILVNVSFVKFYCFVGRLRFLVMGVVVTSEEAVAGWQGGLGRGAEGWVVVGGGFA